MNMARPSNTVSSRRTTERSTQAASPGDNGSDKENRNATASTSANTNKRRDRQAVAPDARPAALGNAQPNKRQQLADRTASEQNSNMVRDYRESLKYYNPDQSESERRELRKGLRDLSRDLHGSVWPRKLILDNSLTRHRLPQ